jgi:hypothetical protein
MTRREYKNTLMAVVGRSLGVLALLGAAGVAAAQPQDAGARYAQMLTDAEITARYNAVIEKQVGTQESEIATLQKQMDGLEQTAADLAPMLDRLFADLQQFVMNDIPFLTSERMARLDRLKDLMTQPDARVEEKFRRLLEAYTIEMEYGRTMDSYKGTLEDGRNVEFVRLGRVSLMYRTVDGQEVGYWDRDQKTWVKSPDYSRAIQKALQIATQAGAPDLITVPVPVARGEKS